MIEQKIRQIVKVNFGITEPLLDFEMDLKLVDIGVSSITFIKTIVAIETEFDFEFDDEDLDYNKFPNIGSLVTYVQNKVSQ